MKYYTVEGAINNNRTLIKEVIYTNVPLSTKQIRKELSKRGFKKVNLLWISGLKEMAV